MYDMIARELIGKTVTILLEGQFTRKGIVKAVEGRILKMVYGKKENIIYFNLDLVQIIEPAE